MSATADLTEPFAIGGLRIANRVVLAPLAGIGNWFVRLQARRHGAALVVSEMVSSHAVHHGNERTCTELLRIHPDERRGDGVVSIQLFGADPDVMRSAAERVADSGADLIDLNMGCPVPKVCKTGAGAALLSDAARAVAVVRAAREGSGLPVTVKMRSGLRQGETTGIELARRLVEDGGAAAITMHPRSAQVQHAGSPDYDLVAGLRDKLGVPLILSGGMRNADAVRAALQRSGADAVMLARGALGNPWLFSQLLGIRDEPPTRDEVLAELTWVCARAAEHLGAPRAGRYLRKFYPWYVTSLHLQRPQAKALGTVLQVASTPADALRALHQASVEEASSDRPTRRYTAALS